MEIDIDKIRSIRDAINRIQFNFQQATYQSHLKAAFDIGTLSEYVDSIIANYENECDECEDD